MSEIGKPTSHDMVRIAIFAERSGYNYREYSTLSRLAKSPPQIRSYALEYLDRLLGQWEGSTPTMADTPAEMAFVAATFASSIALRELNDHKTPRERTDLLWDDRYGEVSANNPDAKGATY